MDDDEINFDFEDSLPAQHAGGVRPVAAQPSGALLPGQGSALAVVDQPPNTSGRHFRQTVCTYWLKGLCMKGEDCGFLHEFDTARMPICRNLIRYGECRDTDCPFKHAMDDLKECNMYKLGFCVYGAHCRYRHTRVPGPPPDPATLDAVRPRPRPGGWGDGSFIRRHDAAGPRPAGPPRPSAADLSSGRVPEPQQPAQRPQHRLQEPDADLEQQGRSERSDQHPQQPQHPDQYHEQQQLQLQQQQHCEDQHQFPDHQHHQHQQFLQQQQQQQQRGMGPGHFPGMGFPQGPGPMQMMGMPFGMPMQMQHPAAFRPFGGMSGPMGPMLGPGGQPMGHIFPNPMQMQMQMQMMRPQFMHQQGMPFQH